MMEHSLGHPDMLVSIDRRTWKKYLFYGDMVVWLIFVVSVALVISNVYVVGWARGEADWAASDAYWWNTITALAFMTASLSWIFYRFWKNGLASMKKPF